MTKNKKRRATKENGFFHMIFSVSLICIFSLFLFARAGSLTPSGPVGSTMHSLEEIYNSLAGTFDSSSQTASATGNIIQQLKYIAQISLQQIYNNSSTASIATNDNKDISFSLTNTATDSNFKINIASGSIGSFQIQDNSASFFTVSSSGVNITKSLSSSLLTLRQDGSGNIIDFKDGAASVFTLADGGQATFFGNIDANGGLDVSGAAVLGDGGLANYLSISNTGDIAFIGLSDTIQKSDGALVINTTSQNLTISTTTSGDLAFTSAGSLTDSFANTSSYDLKRGTESILSVDSNGSLSLNSRGANQNISISASGNGSISLSSNLDLNQKQIIEPVIHSGLYANLPSTPVEGQIYFATDAKQLYVYANAKWQADRTTATKIVAASNSQNKEKADYVADGANDELEIESAIASLPANGGFVQLLDGAYNIGAAIDIVKSNVTLIGAGWGTKLFLINNSGLATCVICAGEGTNTYDNIAIVDFQIDGNKANQTTYPDGIEFNKINYSRIENVYSNNSASDGVLLLTSNNNAITKNRISGSVGNGITLGINSNNNAISFNTVLNNSQSGGIFIYGTNSTASSYDNIIENNIIEGSPYGIRFSNVAPRTVVSNNIIRSSTQDGIYFNVSADYPEQDFQGTSIIGNKIYSNTQNGINLDGSWSNPFNYINISNNFVTLNGRHGINIDGGRYIIIKGNQLYNNSQETNNTYSDLIFDVNMSGIGGDGYNTIDGNVILETNANKAKYGIREESTGENYNYYANNYVSGAVTANVSLQGANRTVYDANSITFSNAESISNATNGRLAITGDLASATDIGYNLGVINAIDTTADVTMTGEATTNGLGFAVSSAGDVNGDGYVDMIAGAIWASKAYIYYGGQTMNNVADITFTGSSDRLGTSVSSAGDVNGDGYADVIVGAPQNNVGGAYAGQAYIYFGGPSMDNVADIVFTGEASNILLGTRVSSAGDVNGDGYADVIVGGYGYNSSQGRAYLYYGGSSMDNVADIVFTGEAVNNYYSYNSISSAGDVNRDGYNDIIIGAYGYNADQGRAYLYYGGSSMDNVADIVFTGEADGDQFGESVSSAGDVNGDGYADVIIGAYGYGSTQGGRAYVYYGGSSMDNVADMTATGSSGYAFGSSVSFAGDVNGDGYADVAVGASNGNRAYIYYGGSTMDSTADVTFSGGSATGFGSYGSSGISAGDVNGDGYNDVIIGAPYYSSNTGRAYIYQGSGTRWKSLVAQNINLSRGLQIDGLLMDRWGLDTSVYYGINTPNWSIDKQGTASFQDIITGGNIGIGVSNPQEKLTIRQDSAGNILSLNDGANNAILSVNDGGVATFKPASFDVVYNFDGVSAYTNNTSEAKTTGGTPFAILSLEASSNDEFYLGLDHKFNTLYFDISTAGAGVTLSAQYYNNAWTDFAITDGTSNLAQDGAITFSAPSDWIQTSVNSITKFWIRLRSSSTNITTAPLANFVSPTTGNRFYVYSQSGDSNPTFHIDDKGNVGIGTASPPYKFTVIDPAYPTLPSLASTIMTIGSSDGLTTGTSIRARGAITGGLADFGEYIKVKGNASNYEQGDLLVVDLEMPEQFTKSANPYENTLSGIVTTTAGIIAGGGDEYIVYDEKTGKPSNRVIMALSGRVPIKVSLENGPILIGDYLTSSSVSGVAMKAEKQGRTIGIALESYSVESQTGKIIAFINPGWTGGDLEVAQTEKGSIADDARNSINMMRAKNLSINENGYLEVENFKAKEIEVGNIKIKPNSNRGGITIYDRATDEPYCIFFEDGQIKNERGECGAEGEISNENSSLSVESSDFSEKSDDSNNNLENEDNFPDFVQKNGDNSENKESIDEFNEKENKNIDTFKANVDEKENSADEALMNDKIDDVESAQEKVELLESASVTSETHD